MKFYCVKCRAEVEVPKYETKIIKVRGSDRKMLVGKCNKCGTKTTKFAKM